MELGRAEKTAFPQQQIAERIENIMFGFRIIYLSDGNQVIDRRLKTPYSSLTPVQMVEYTEMDGMLSLMDRMDQKAKAESEGRRNFVRNLLWKLACVCGLA